ncbi:MAG TPA: bilirubin oxidase, partial [Halothiobacillus sp.]|nr:bilirubin oxidase [Halothiobacillus sp.]HQT65775.1 hypothetical protein [Acidocella sp.]
MSHDCSHEPSTAHIFPQQNPEDEAKASVRSPDRRRALKTLMQGATTVFSGMALEGLVVPAQAQGMGMMGGMMGQSAAAPIQPGVFSRPMPIPSQLTGTTDSAGVQVYELKASAGQHAELVAGLRT